MKIRTAVPRISNQPARARILEVTDRRTREEQVLLGKSKEAPTDESPRLFLQPKSSTSPENGAKSENTTVHSAVPRTSNIKFTKHCQLSPLFCA